MLPKAELKKLRNKLPKYYSKLLAEKTGFSESYVRAVLFGRRINTCIIDDAITLANENKKAIASKRKKIKSL